jgi:arylsulfatase A-like enzyme
MINMVDVFATLCDITDGRLPISKAVAPDSLSFRDALIQSGKKHERVSMVTADARGMHALRRGNWKYIDNTTPEAWSQRRRETFRDVQPQLYNLADDPAESRNLVAREPHIAEKLAAELGRIRNARATR